MTLSTWLQTTENNALWDKIHQINPIFAFIIITYDTLVRFFYNLPDMPRDGYRKCKRGVQRAYRGWSSEDVWECYAYQSRVIYAMLVELRRTKYGFPATADPVTGEYGYNEERWNEILDKIIYAFKLSVDVANGNREGYCINAPAEYRALTQQEEMDRRLGIILYAEYLFNLWD